MLLYNTLTQKKEALPKEDVLKLFVCGPTVNNYPHIGNFRVFVFFDMFARYLRAKGIRLSYLQNITDIDDKIIQKAKEDNQSWKEVSKKFTKAFKTNLKELGVVSVNKYAPATDFIPEIIKQIKKLIQKGHAYKIENDGWYFDLSTFKDYGKLSKRTAEQAEDSVSRIDENPDKRNKGDFALWKFSKLGEPSWKTELGEGRPGWHIEDTAITEHFFGPQYDMHGGGMDLMFPHHEAEIAQQESASGKKPFVKTWMHVAMLTVNGKKMSKSLGNVVTINTFLKTHSPNLFRFLVLSHQYRSSFDFNPLMLDQAQKGMETIFRFLAKSQIARKNISQKADFEIPVKQFKTMFEEALEDDFNTPEALGALYSLINEADSHIWSSTPDSLKETEVFIKYWLTALGFEIPKIKIPLKVKGLAAKREKYRVSKQFEQSDQLRRIIDELGYIIEDTPAGPFLWPKHLS